MSEIKGLPPIIMYRGKQYGDCIHIETKVRISFVQRLRDLFSTIMLVHYLVYTDAPIDRHVVENTITRISYTDMIKERIVAWRYRILGNKATGFISAGDGEHTCSMSEQKTFREGKGFPISYK